MGFKGSVDSFSLADVFQNLAMNQQSGTLHVFTPASEEKFIFFQSGQVHFLSRGQSKPLVPPDVYIARGYVAQNQLDEALNLQQQKFQTIGNCLMELGHVTQKQVEEVVKLQIEEEIFDLFGWETANFEFDEVEADASVFSGQTGNAARGPGLVISHLIMEAARRVDEWDRLRKQIPSFKEVYYLDHAARKAIEKGEMETDAVEKRVASLLDCARDVEDVVADSALFKFEVLNALSGFIQSLWARPATVAELTAAEQECLKQNLPRRRIKVLERILALGGENARVRRELAESLAKDQQVDKACIHYNVLADGELAAKRQDGAVELYKRILALSPKHIKAHEQLGAIYAKRGQKREAFVHFQDLYETYREQNNARDARTAAIHALENDPLHTDLRTGLVELLVNDHQKDAASQQLEILGDQAARQGSTKIAADAYRRAMQYRPNNAQLKKKLTDVMLTKEDRLARKRRFTTVMILILLLAGAAGGLFYKEHLNKVAFLAAETAADPLMRKAEEANKIKEFLEARRNFELAAAEYRRVAKAISPVFNYGEMAKKRIKDLEESAAQAQYSFGNRESAEKAAAERDLEAAKEALSVLRFYDARDKLDLVLSNSFAAESVVAEARRNKTEIDEKIAGFENGRKRLADDPQPPFQNIEDEYAWKKQFIETFERFQDGKGSIQNFRAGSVMLPVRIKTDADEVNVKGGGQPLGAVGRARGDKVNTLRYPGGASYIFEFTRRGYRTIVLNTLALRGPYFEIVLKREPSTAIPVKQHLGGASVVAEPTLEGDTFYLGLSDGHLAQVQEGENPVRRKFKLKNSNPLLEEVVGQIYIHRRGDKSYIVYGTRAGDCAALVEDGAAFTAAWTRLEKPDSKLAASPTSAKLAGISGAIFVLPMERRLVLVNCDDGRIVNAANPQVDFAARIVSSVTGIEAEALLVAGCENGKLFGLDLRTNTLKHWDAQKNILALKTRPALFENKLYVGADDGVIYIFDLKKDKGFSVNSIKTGGIGLVGDPLIFKRHMYVGADGKEMLCIADLNIDAVVKTVPVAGNVMSAPIALDNIIYFATDQGWLYSMDSETRAVRWSYQMDRGVPIIGSPLLGGAGGRRIYIVGKDGTILGFDE